MSKNWAGVKAGTGVEAGSQNTFTLFGQPRQSAVANAVLSGVTATDVVRLVVSPAQECVEVLRKMRTNPAHQEAAQFLADNLVASVKSTTGLSCSSDSLSKGTAQRAASTEIKEKAAEELTQTRGLGHS